jgi:putative endonuclease
VKAPAASTRREAGAHWEAFALAHLRQAGLVEIARNFSCRQGELDLVMRERDVVVFVEVRYRRKGAAGRFGDGVDSVGSSKRAKLARAASVFLAAHPRLAQCACRFDVIAIGAGEGERAATLEWIRNAFETSEGNCR